MTPHRQVEDGADLLLELRAGGGLSTRMFVVQARGTPSHDPGEWANILSRMLRSDTDPAFLPVCGFVFNLPGEGGAWAWIAEPVVQPDGPVLRDHDHVQPQSLDDPAAAQIIDQVAAWYAARAAQLQPA